MPLDEPPDLLYRLIVHELTHQFEFDMIPTSLIRRSSPSDGCPPSNRKMPATPHTPSSLQDPQVSVKRGQEPDRLRNRMRFRFDDPHPP